jgi:hypothetical protein
MLLSETIVQISDECLNHDSKNEMWHPKPSTTKGIKTSFLNNPNFQSNLEHNELGMA